MLSEDRKTAFKEAWQKVFNYENFDYRASNEAHAQIVSTTTILPTSAAQKAHKPTTYDDLLLNITQSFSDQIDFHRPSGENGISIFQYACATGDIEIAEVLLDNVHPNHTKLPAEYWNECYVLAQQVLENSNQYDEEDLEKLIKRLKRVLHMSSKSQLHEPASPLTLD